MPIRTQPLYEIRVRQEFLGQNMVNLYYYEQTDGDEPIELGEIAQEFQDEVYQATLAVQHNGVAGVDLRVRDVGGVSELTQDLTSTTGERPGEPLNSFSAFGFTYLRSSIDIRNGGKRIGGISEDDVSGNGLDMIIMGLLDNLADVMERALEDPSDWTLLPVIYRRDSFDEGSWFGTRVAGVISRGITSQVSRKAPLGGG